MSPFCCWMGMQSGQHQQQLPPSDSEIPINTFHPMGALSWCNRHQRPARSSVSKLGVPTVPQAQTTPLLRCNQLQTDKWIWIIDRLQGPVGCYRSKRKLCRKVIINQLVCLRASGNSCGRYGRCGAPSLLKLSLEYRSGRWFHIGAIRAARRNRGPRGLLEEEVCGEVGLRCEPPLPHVGLLVATA